MANFVNHHSQSLTKALVLGNSGAGKTVLTASLANAGLNVRIWDYDNGLDALAAFLNPEAVSRVAYETLVDRPGDVPSAYTKGNGMFNGWKDPQLPPISRWTSQDVIVIDSLTMHGRAAMRYVQAVSGRTGKAPQIQEWGEAMRLQEEMLDILYSTATPCNVVCNAHLTFMEDSDGLANVRKGFPSALGSKLPPKVGRYFNSVLLVETKGIGANASRVLRTVSTANIELKNPAPKVVPPEMEPDLAKYFQLVQQNAAKMKDQAA